MRLRGAAALLPIMIYGAVTFAVVVATSGWLWWFVIKAVLSGDFARHPVGSIIGMLASLPILAPMVILAWLAGLGCYRAFQRLAGHSRIQAPERPNSG